MQSWTSLQTSSLQQVHCGAYQFVLGEAARIASHLRESSRGSRKCDADLRDKGQAHGNVC
jgi:hypothetical protein